MYNESSRNADLVSEYLVATTASNRYSLVQHYIFQLHHPVCIAQCASPIQTSWPSDVSDLHVVSVVADVHVLAWSSPRSPVTAWLHYHKIVFLADGHLHIRSSVHRTSNVNYHLGCGSCRTLHLHLSQGR